MSRPPYVLALDQGTTGTRAVVYGPGGRPVASSYREFTQFFPRPGWVEHDAAEIWEVTQAVVRGALRGLDPRRVAAVGVTNQRETTVVWDRKTGRPLARAVVWQDRRTEGTCARLKARGLEAAVRRTTGLVLDPYFSATKVRWLLDETPGLRARARRGEALFGTVDSWLLWNLTGGRAHATDLTNASRTMLFDIHRARWDTGLLSLFGVPAAMLPRALPSGGRFGSTSGGGPLPAGIPVTAMLGDQQAALYGQSCYGPGAVKNTYGTGCFVVANTGPRRREPPPGLLATLACDERGRKTYALEGSVFAAGAAVQWLRDGLGVIAAAADSERLARSVPDAGGVTLVPAFTGLGSPHWRPDVRGALFGLTRGTTRAHLARATLEAVAHQTADVVEAMGGLKVLKADGGMTANAFLMQLQADLLGVPVAAASSAESTAWGAAKLAGRVAGLWGAEVDAGRRARVFRPRMARAWARAMRRSWKAALAVLLRPAASALAILFLSAAPGAAAPSPQTPLPTTDMALDMRFRMDQIEPQVKVLADANERLMSLLPRHASGADPDAAGLGRAAARADVEAAAARLKHAVGGFWHGAEALRVAKTADYFLQAAAGRSPDGRDTAAAILQPPAFPKTAMHVYHNAQVLLAYEEQAYTAAKQRWAKRWELRAGLGLGGLLLGALLSAAVTVFLPSSIPPRLK